MSGPPGPAESEVPPEIRRRLAEVFDFARALAQARLEQLDAPDADIAPFGVAAAGEELVPILLEDVREHLATPAGTNRVAGTLLQRYEADAFAIATTAAASPDGSAEHPQAREVLRIVVGHRSGPTDAMFCEIERRPEGPRFAGPWESRAG